MRNGEMHKNNGREQNCILLACYNLRASKSSSLHLQRARIGTFWPMFFSAAYVQFAVNGFAGILSPLSAADEGDVRFTLRATDDQSEDKPERPSLRSAIAARLGFMVATNRQSNFGQKSTASEKTS